MSKYRRVRVRNKTYRIRQNISWDLRNAAEELAQRLRNLYKFDGWLTRKDIPQVLINRELLEPNYEQQLKLLGKRLDDYKFQLYLERENPVATKKTIVNIERTKKTILEISSRIAWMDQFTLEGYADSEATRYILRCLTSPKIRNFKELMAVEEVFNISTISVSKIREISRTEPWRSYWSARKQGSFRVYPLSSEQLSLCSFSKMYDGVYRHTEKPPEYVIENDDMLDGWIISITRDDQAKSKGSTKVQNSREVFVMANNQLEANEVYAKNPTDVRFVQQSRQKQLERQGAVRYADFGDVKRERHLSAQK